MKRYLLFLALIILVGIVFGRVFSGNFEMERGYNGLMNIGQALYIKSNGSTTDFSIDSSSATFYDTVNLNSYTYSTTPGYIMLKDETDLWFGTNSDFAMSYKDSTNNLTINKFVTPMVTVNITDVKITTKTIVAVNGTNEDFTVGATSATFYDTVFFSSAAVAYSQTMAQLKAFAPAYVGGIYYDTTNKALVVSTGTSAGQFAIIYGGAKPTGW